MNSRSRAEAGKNRPVRVNSLWITSVNPPLDPDLINLLAHHIHTLYPKFSVIYRGVYIGTKCHNMDILKNISYLGVRFYYFEQVIYIYI